MERVIERCAGLDVRKKTVAVCVRVPGADGTRDQHVRTFGTTAPELLAVRDWLQAHGVTDVAMESTGSTGNPSSMCSRTRSRVCSSTRLISPRYPGERRMSGIACGLANCW